MASIRKTTEAERRGRKVSKGATRKSTRAGVRKPAYGWLNRLLVVLGAGVVVAAGVQGYIALRAIPVQRIVVTGELENTQTEVLQELVQPALVGGFLSADLQRIRAQLESLPWIYQASVRRRWPSMLEIHVIEQLPIARWGSEGFLNHEGQVFSSSLARDWGTLPLLRGPQGTATAMMAKYQKLLEVLAPLELVVQQLEMDRRGQLEARFVGGWILALGNTDMVPRLQRFSRLYSDELGARAQQLVRVDLRYESGLAVQFREPTQLAEI